MYDTNKTSGFTGAQATAVGINGAGQPVNAAGAVLPTTNFADTFQVRMRVQRDF